MPSATALGGHEAAAAACLRQAPANFERGIRAFKIHVFPLEGQELALPQARGDSQHVEGPIRSPSPYRGTSLPDP